MVGKRAEADIMLAGICFMIAAALVFASILIEMSEGWRWFLRLCALFIGIAGVILTANGLEAFANRRLEDAARIAERKANNNPEIMLVRETRELMDRFSVMPELQMKVLLAHPGLIPTLFSNIGPDPYVETEDGKVPYTFIDEWFSENENRVDDNGYHTLELKPVRDWRGTGGNRPLHAMWLTRHLSRYGFIDASGGPNQARWFDNKGPQKFFDHFYGERIRRIVKVAEEWGKGGEKFELNPDEGGEA